MNKNKYMIGLLLLVFSINNSFATDIDILYDRYWKLCLNNPSKANIDASLKLLSIDGSFSDLDYGSTATLSIHLDRLNSFAVVYQTKNSAYYHEASLKNKIYASMQFWIAKNHRPKNWWYRHIQYPRKFGPCLFLINEEMQAEKPRLYDAAIDYLLWAYLKNDHMEGANGADKIYAAFPASILTKNNKQLKEYQRRIKELIVVQNKGEGIEADWMYGQHSRKGRQLYANYEHEYLNSILKILDICKGTTYSVSSVELKTLDNHIINGSQWYAYNKRQDPSQTGRKPSASLNSKFVNNIKMMLGLNTSKRSEILNIHDRILYGKNASSKLIGNRMFWRFDYMIHRRENYFVSSRLTSTRTVGMESGNGEGVENYYTSSGLNFLLRSGNEYDYPYFTKMNFRQWPGITVEQDRSTLPLVDWGRRSRNRKAFAGGVSNGHYGAIGTIYKKRRVKAYKSCFYFDNEYVALGSGIKASNATKAPIFTTINQTLQKNTITYSKNKSQQRVEKGSGTINVSNLNWVLQDSIAYLNLLPTSKFKISSDIRSGTPIFTVGIDHGEDPKDADYAYLVYPNTSVVSVGRYCTNLPLEILSNTKILQAVYHKDLRITQAIFYKAGSITLANGNILTVDKPSAIMIKDLDFKYQITVGNPLCETSNPDSITITIDVKLYGPNTTWDGKNSEIKIKLPQGDYAGQSVSTIVPYKND